MRDRDTIRRGQLDALKILCRELAQTNRFYAPRLKQAGLDPETLTLDTFSSRMPFTERREWVQDQLDTPPFGTDLTYPVDQYSRFSRTSGSTGTPMIWLDTQKDWGNMLDCWSRVYAAAGLDHPHRIFFAFSFGPFLGFWTAYDAAGKLGHMCIPAGGLSSLGRLKLLLDTQAEVLCATPTYAIRLAHVAAEHRHEIDLSRANVKKIIVAGEAGGSIPATREHIASHWNGAEVFDHHGMTEVGPVSYPCPADPTVLHVMEDAYYAEVVDDELVLTTLKRVGSPLLRYRTGDVVSAERRSPCECGSHDLCLLGGILGRKDDMVVVRGVNVFPSAVEGIVRSIPGINEYQVEVHRGEDATELKLRIETAGGEPVRNELQKHLHGALFLRIPVEIVSAGSLPRFELKARRWVQVGESHGGEE